MSLLEKFDALMSLLNGEENSLAEEVREMILEAKEDLEFLECLRAAGVDNWSGFEIAQDMMDWEEDDE